MKFFSDLGSCYRATTATAAADEEVTDLPSPVTGARVIGGGGTRRQKSLTSKSGSGLHWQPTLSAISEDSVASAPPKGGERRGQGHQVLKKSPAKGRPVTKSRSYSTGDEDYNRESSMVMAIPAFSPTPFIF